MSALTRNGPRHRLQGMAVHSSHSATRARRRRAMPSRALGMRSRGRIPARSRGVALVIVLWITVSAGDDRARHGTGLPDRVDAGAQPAGAGQGARAWPTARSSARCTSICGRRSRKRSGFPNGAVHGWDEDGVKLAASIAYESGRIDLNFAREPLLKGLLMSAAGLKFEDAERHRRRDHGLARSRRLSSVRRGAEASDYKAAGRNYVPANANFETIEEVQRVLGMTPEIYAKIADLITVHSRQPGIDPAGASRGVLLAIPSLTPEIVDDYIARREDARSLNQPAPPLSQAVGYVSIGAAGFHVNGDRPHAGRRNVRPRRRRVSQPAIRSVRCSTSRGAKGRRWSYPAARTEVPPPTPGLPNRPRDETLTMATLEGLSPGDQVRRFWRWWTGELVALHSGRTSQLGPPAFGRCRWSCSEKGGFGIYRYDGKTWKRIAHGTGRLRAESLAKALAVAAALGADRSFRGRAAAGAVPVQDARHPAGRGGKPPQRAAVRARPAHAVQGRRGRIRLRGHRSQRALSASWSSGWSSRKSRRSPTRCRARRRRR